jgi:Sec-independent protein translocase protein TatA
MELRWFDYYWALCRHFGYESYKTWRAELFSSALVAAATFGVTQSLREFKTALLSVGITLGAFLIWHLIRLPWILHRAKENGDSQPGFWSGALGLILLVAALIGAGKLGAALWNARPLGEIVSEIRLSDPAKDARITQLEQEVSGLEAQEQTQKQPQRELTGTQRDELDELIQQLSEISGTHEMAVRFYPGSEESRKYEAELVEALYQGGWKSRPPKVFWMGNPTFYGVVLLVNTVNTSPPQAKELYASLKSKGIDVRFNEVKNNTDDLLEMYVGLQ